MCDKCKPIDEKLARYRILNSRIGDQQTLDGLAQLILELEALKRALHPIE